MLWDLLKKPAAAMLKALDLYSAYQLRTGGPLRDDGWFRSVREQRSVDANGQPIPWFTYPAIDFLSRRVRAEWNVFEYGCGMSTLWWGERVRRVVSCEHDRLWYERVAASVPKNVELHLVPLDDGDSYAGFIGKWESAFDIVVLDGRKRVDCALRAVRALAPSGVIVWDNSDRDEYRAGYEYLEGEGFRKIEFTGFAPIVNLKSETGVFFRDSNCLGL